MKPKAHRHVIAVAREAIQLYQDILDERNVIVPLTQMLERALCIRKLSLWIQK
jgi:hypothetical protein